MSSARGRRRYFLTSSLSYLLTFPPHSVEVPGIAEVRGAAFLHRFSGETSIMAEVLAQFAEPVVGEHGVAYRAQACGAPATENLWEGWIEFVPVDGGAPVRSPRETTQPNRTDAVYWASGLTAVYLEGALNRALKPLVIKAPPPLPASNFEAPAPAVDVRPTIPLPRPHHEAVLNPFSVYEKGEALLRKELGALSAWHLVNIILAYDLSDQPSSSLNKLPSATLVEIILKGIQTSEEVRK